MGHMQRGGSMGRKERTVEVRCGLEEYDRLSNWPEGISSFERARKTLKGMGWSPAPCSPRAPRPGAWPADRAFWCPAHQIEWTPATRADPLTLTLLTHPSDLGFLGASAHSSSTNHNHGNSQSGEGGAAFLYRCPDRTNNFDSKSE